MVWYFIFGSLAAFGFLCALLVLFGCLLGCGRGGVLVLSWNKRTGALLLRLRMLRELGLLHCRILLAAEDLSLQEQAYLLRQHPDVVFCRPEELPERMELEREL